MGSDENLEWARDEIDDAIQCFVAWLEQAINLGPEAQRRLNALSTGLVYGFDDTVQPESVSPKIDEILLRKFNYLCKVYRAKGYPLVLPGTGIKPSMLVATATTMSPQ